MRNGALLCLAVSFGTSLAAQKNAETNRIAARIQEMIEAKEIPGAVTLVSGLRRRQALSETGIGSADDQHPDR